MALAKVFDSKIVRSAIAFQLVWFALILFPPVVATLSLVAYVVFHILYVDKNPRFWLFSLRIFFVGVALDSFMFYSRVMYVVGAGQDSVQDHYTSTLLPYWLIALWFCFSLALPIAFGFLKKHFALCIVFGLSGAPLSYLSGAKLRGDIEFMEPFWLSLVFVGIAWSALLCLAIFWLRKMDGTSKGSDKFKSSLLAP